MRLTLIIVFSFYSHLIYSSNTYNIRDYGAIGDSLTINTIAIQNAIDQAAKDGGGVILVEGGQYVTGTISLRSNITIRITSGSAILGSTDINDYPGNLGGFTDAVDRKYGSPLIYGKNLNNISLEGNGIINGRGFEKFFPPNAMNTPRPALIRLISCNYIKIRNLFLTNSAAWVQHLVRCNDVLIDGINVLSYSNGNNDGIDIDGGERIMLINSNFNTADDAIVLKNLSATKCQDILVSNCIVSSRKSAFKIGTESVGDFENINVINLTIYNSRGINIYSVDGANLNNINISNVVMRNSYATIMIRLGERMRNYHSTDSLNAPIAAGSIKNLSFTNIQATGVEQTNDFISGIPGHYIENISLNNISIEYTAKQDSQIEPDQVPNVKDKYPMNGMFGQLSSFSFFIRHAKNVTFNEVMLKNSGKDSRPAISTYDVHDLTLNRIRSEIAIKAPAMFYLSNSERVYLTNNINTNDNTAKLYTSNNKLLPFMKNNHNLSLK